MNGIKRIVVLSMLLATSTFAALIETPSEFEPHLKPDEVRQLDSGDVVLTWVGKKLIHIGVFRVSNGSNQCVLEAFQYRDKHRMSTAEINKFLAPYYKIGLSAGKVTGVAGDNENAYVPLVGDAIVYTRYNFDTNALTVSLWDMKPHQQQHKSVVTQPVQPDEKADCVIVAAENLKKLKPVTQWAQIVGFQYTINGNDSPVGHAVVVFKFSDEGKVYVIDKTGTRLLPTTSTDIGSIQTALGAMFGAIYSKSGKVAVAIKDIAFLK